MKGKHSRTHESHSMWTFLWHFVLKAQYQREHCNCKQTQACTSTTYKALSMGGQRLLCYSNLWPRQTERRRDMGREGLAQEEVGRGATPWMVSLTFDRKPHEWPEWTANQFTRWFSLSPPPHLDIQWAIITHFITFLKIIQFQTYRIMCSSQQLSTLA